MSDAEEEMLAMHGRAERRALPGLTGSTLTAAAALFRRMEEEAGPTEEWIVGDVSACGVRVDRMETAFDAPSPSDLLARRERAVRLDGGVADDTAG